MIVPTMGDTPSDDAGTTQQTGKFVAFSGDNQCWKEVVSRIGFEPMTH